MKKATIISTLLIGILLSGGTAFAWHGGQGNRNCNDSYSHRGQRMTDEQHEKWRENRLEKMGIILDLTEQQKNQLENLFEKKGQDHQSLQAKIQTSRNELREDQYGKNFNEADFRTKAQKHAELKTEMMVQRAKTKQQICTILTPEQQKKAEKLWNIRAEGLFSKRGGNHDNSTYGKRGSKGYGKR